MHPHPTPRFTSFPATVPGLRTPLKAAALALSLSASVLSTHAVTQYTFNGTTDSNWATAGNWSSNSVAPTNGTFSARRININGAALIYSATQGTTQYDNTVADRAFVITSGSLTFTGGSFTSNNTFATVTEDILGNAASAVSTLTVNGGSYTTKDLVMNFSGGSATTTLNVQSGSATITNLKVQALTSGNTTVNLDGGTLAVTTLTATGAGTKTFNFNGGTLRTNGSLTLSGFNNAFIKSGGAVINTNGFDSTVNQALLTDAVSTGGGLTKSGSGTLTLTGDNTYTGATQVDAGTLALGAANRIANASNLVMAGGTFATGGFSETLGTLGLTASSIIDLGAGASSLVFSDSSGVAWGGSISLSFVNFTNGSDSVRIGTSASGLTELQLAQITINGQAATIDGNGFLGIAAIPEPSTYAMAAGLGALVLTAGSRSRRSARVTN